MATKKRTKALARRPARTQELQPKPISPAGETSHGNWLTLGDGPQLPASIGQRNPLSALEQKMLNTPVDIGDVRIKPSGEVYVPHIGYTRFCNKTFGVGEWALVPGSKPLFNGKTVVVSFVLYVHGAPVASAVGEQDYFEENKKQTPGDAIEACYASGLRRTLKRIGLWLELWDPEFGEDFKARYCVRVAVQIKNDTVKMWRKKDQRAFYGETDKRQPPQQQEKARKQRQDMAVAAAESELIEGDATISDEAVVHFWHISRNRGRDDNEVKAWLKSHGYNRVNEIKVKYFDAICRAVQSSGELPQRRKELP